MSFPKMNGLIAVAFAVASMTMVGIAQDGGSEGIVRISDGKARSNVTPASFGGHHGGFVGGGCPTGNCPSGNCPTGGCPNGGCPNCHCKFCCLFKEHYCHVSPDYGYSPPAKYPLHRRGVQYNTYYPQNWYGTPGANFAAAPMVYQPTDTTQLGFYYQHVPFWQPNPNALPQRPVPSQYHIIAPATNIPKRGHFGRHGGGACPPGGDIVQQAPIQQPGAPIEQSIPSPTPNALEEAQIPLSTEVPSPSPREI